MLRTLNLTALATRPWRLRPGAFIRRVLAPALLVISVWPGVGGSDAFARGPPPPPTRPAVPDLVYDGGGMMAYPLSMAPIPGIYKAAALMYPMTRAQIDNFKSDRFPMPSRFLLHQWEDTHEGLIHRSSFISKLPLQVPITQQDFYIEHQANESLYHSAGAVVRAYKLWLKTRPGYRTGHN